MAQRQQLEASLRISKFAEDGDRRVEIQPHGVWKGSPTLSHWPVVYGVSLLLRRLRRIRSWDVVTSSREVAGNWEETNRCVAPSREAAEQSAVASLLEGDS